MGIGYQEKLTEETTNRWWEQMYNKAASNVVSTGTQKEESGFDTSAFSKLTDEELFKACGGRTAHKAARHGLHLGGKLERIEHQEKKSLSKEKKRKRNSLGEFCDDEEHDEPIKNDKKILVDETKKRKKRTKNEVDDGVESNNMEQMVCQKKKSSDKRKKKKT